jgi:hypothetical protein
MLHYQMLFTTLLICWKYDSSFGEDDEFDDEDYILFYAEGLDTWNEESLTHNLYDVKSYYYVTIKGEWERISEMTQPVATAL